VPFDSVPATISVPALASSVWLLSDRFPVSRSTALASFNVRPPTVRVSFNRMVSVAGDPVMTARSPGPGTIEPVHSEPVFQLPLLPAQLIVAIEACPFSLSASAGGHKS